MSFCNASNSQLPVPQSTDDSTFLASIGTTYLGIQGQFDNGVVTWEDIYTKVYILTVNLLLTFTLLEEADVF